MQSFGRANKYICSLLYRSTLQKGFGHSFQKIYTLYASSRLPTPKVAKGLGLQYSSRWIIVEVHLISWQNKRCKDEWKWNQVTLGLGLPETAGAQNLGKA